MPALFPGKYVLRSKADGWKKTIRLKNVVDDKGNVAAKVSETGLGAVLDGYDELRTFLTSGDAERLVAFEAVGEHLSVPGLEDVQELGRSWEQHDAEREQRDVERGHAGNIGAAEGRETATKGRCASGSTAKGAA